MNTHDLPMVIFTLFSQMAVGTFIALGVIEFALGRRSRSDLRDRVIAPVLYAVGPVLVVGLLVSMLHMHDVTNVFNVITHPESSWLSREILFGVGFAGFGFCFALLEWFGWGSAVLRQVIAVVTAVVGVGLVVSESMVYYSLVAVPAWHSWMIPLEFFGTTILLGVLAVAAALMGTTLVRAKHKSSGDQAVSAAQQDSSDDSGRGGLAVQVRQRVSQINAPTSDEEWAVTALILKWSALVSAVTAIILLVAYPLYLTGLSQGTAAAQASVDVMTGPMLAWRLILLGVVAVLMGVFVYRMADTVTLSNARVLVGTVLICLVLAFTSEFMGRLLHYASMIRVGI